MAVKTENCMCVRWPECLECQANILLHQNVSCEVLHELLSLTSVPVRYEVVPELSTTLLLALNHANKSSRIAAVRHLYAKLTHGNLVCHCCCQCQIRWFSSDIACSVNLVTPIVIATFYPDLKLTI